MRVAIAHREHPYWELWSDELAGAGVNRVQGGFTLIELILVVVILGILAAVALPQYSGLRESGEKSVADAAVAAVAAAAALCYSSQRRKCTFVEITGPSYLNIDPAIAIAGPCPNVTATSGSTSSTVNIAQYCV